MHQKKKKWIIEVMIVSKEVTKVKRNDRKKKKKGNVINEMNFIHAVVK